MKDLMITQNQTLTMSSREIAELLCKNHSDIKRSTKRLYEAGILTQPLAESEFNHRGNTYTEYLLVKRDCLVLVAQNSPEFTAAIVDRWQELESQELQAIPNFTDPAQAARAWAEQYEANAEKQKQLELAAPKVEFHDKVVNDENTFSFRDAAKKIQQRPNKLIDWLRGKGYLCLNNMAKQQYIAQGLFATHSGVSDTGHHYTQCRVTGKGLSYFIEKLGSEKL